MDLMLTDAPVHYAGGGFPWGLLIIGGIVYFLWTKGVFDGRGRFGNGPRNGGGYGGGYGPGSGPVQTMETPSYGAGSGQGSNPGYGDPRAQFEAWHRQAHESGSGHAQAPAAPQTPPAAAATQEPESPTTGESDPPRQV